VKQIDGVLPVSSFPAFAFPMREVDGAKAERPHVCMGSGLLTPPLTRFRSTNMRSIELCRRLVVSALVVAAPLSLRAQERVLGTFNGRVDKEVRITMRGGDVSSNTLSGQDLRTRYRMAAPLPQQDGTVRVAVTNGRGDVSVIQQPTAANGYTAVIRIFDRSSGADVYRLSTYWSPLANGEVLRPGGILGRRGGRGNLPTLHWSGDVDGTVELRWRGSNVNQRVLNGNALRGVSSTVSGDVLQGQAGQATVNLREGRGRVDVVQQPAPENRYTTVVRITDPARSYGHYDFDVIWR